MNPHDEQPLVSILTPVYNGAAFLRECIESVLSQTYMNWDYTIVDNRSTDGTAEIAKEYANKDHRVHVSTNPTFLPIIANHNRAFKLIDPAAKYCKVVSADDWLYPECIARTVGVAEAHPSVGIVGSYQLSGGRDEWCLRNDGLPYSETFISGLEICRRHLLEPRINVFGNPTSTLYRADLVRATEAFYPNETAEADRSACFKHLQSTDYGFVHQVLSFERDGHIRTTTRSRDLCTYLSSHISDVLEYGPGFLTEEERASVLAQLLGSYYQFLAGNLLNRRGRDFWKYHKLRLADLGYPLSNVRLVNVAMMLVIDRVLNPKHTVESLIQKYVSS